MRVSVLVAVLAVVSFIGCGDVAPSRDGGATGGGGGATGGGGGATGSGGGATGGGGGATGGGGGATGGGGGGTSLDAGCTRLLAPADAPRAVVVSHPFPADGGSRDNRFELLTLTADGALTPRHLEFRMGRASVAESFIVFTPDGLVGLAPQSDGTLGVFRLEADGGVTVVHEAFDGNFSAGRVLMHPSGRSAYVLDFNTQNNGGGVYEVDIGCDGSLSNVRQVLAGNNAGAGAWLPSGSAAVIASRSLGSSPAMQDLHLVDLDAGAVLTSATGFPDRDAIASTVAVSADGRWVTMADNGFLVGSRIGVFERVGNTLTGRQVLATPNPVGVAFSPWGTWGLVVNSDGQDQFRRLTFDAQAGTFAVATSALPYAHGRPQLPTGPLQLDRGALQGRVLVGELDALRQLQFERDGGITDVSRTSVSGTGNAQILGTLGVAP